MSRTPHLPGPTLPAGSETRLRAALLAALGVMTALAVAHALWYWPEVIDDAYITLRYARNLVDGFGLRFNPTGPAVEGYSNPTWMALAALLLTLRVPDLFTAMTGAGLALHALTAVLVWFLVGGREERRSWAALVGPLFFACNPFAAYHAVTGLETPLYAALLAAAGVAATRLGRTRVAGALFAIALVLVIATRPEGFGYAAGLLAASAWFHRADGRARRLVGRAGIACAVALAALTVFRWTTFGALLPNTFTAKSAGPAAGTPWWNGIAYTYRFFLPDALPAVVVLVAAAAWQLARTRDRVAAVLAVPAVCAIGFAVAVRGDWMHSFRFLVPAVPFLAALVGRAAVRLEAIPARGTRMALAALAVALCLAQTLIGIAHSDGFRIRRSHKPLAWPLRLARQVAQPLPVRLAGVTRWSLDHLAPGQSVATGDIGFPAWVSDASIVDLVGLTDATLARIVPANDTAAYAACIRQRRPDWIVLRLQHGEPGAGYDALTLRSGVLAGYVATDSVATYGEDAIARIYRRAGLADTVSRAQVLERYRRAVRSNPRVAQLREWMADAERR